MNLLEMFKLFNNKNFFRPNPPFRVRIINELVKFIFFEFLFKWKKRTKNSMISNIVILFFSLFELKIRNKKINNKIKEILFLTKSC